MKTRVTFVVELFPYLTPKEGPPIKIDSLVHDIELKSKPTEATACMYLWTV